MPELEQIKKMLIKDDKISECSEYSSNLNNEDESMKKISLLKKLFELKKLGIELTQNYNLNSNLKLMELEYNLHEDEKNHLLTIKKLTLLKNLANLKNSGVVLSQNYNLNSDIKLMEYEYKLHDDIRKENEELMMKKIILLKKIVELQKNGVQFTQNYDLSSNINIMEYEYNLCQNSNK